jgi:glycosyltransferase involved in cell wall biosynthesis
VFFTDDRSELGSDLIRQLPACEIVNLHWIAGFVDYRSFFRAVAARMPLVWTLHDANPFTGGCHYYGPCERFMRGCGLCPELGSSSERDLSRAIWQRKKESYSFLRSGRLQVVTPSRWLAGEVQKSALLGGFPVRTIPNGFETEVFSPRDRVLAREMLGVPRDSKVVLFAAQSLGERRKGFAALAQALAPFSPDTGIHLVSVGHADCLLDVRLPHLNLGLVDNDRILSWVYSAADVYVAPTLDDNLPNTVMEAMSCGTPVVGFDTGGVPEMVRNGMSGFVVPKGDTGALRQAILRLLDNSALRTEMAGNSRRIAVEGYDIRLQARRYLSLYQDLLPRSHPGSA